MDEVRVKHDSGVEMVRVESVLIVEDDRALREVMVEGLSRRGFHMREAECVAAAIHEIQNLPPSAILVDYQLPDVPPSIYWRPCAVRNCAFRSLF